MAKQKPNAAQPRQKRPRDPLPRSLGGSFAPPITTKDLTRYRKLAEEIEEHPEVKEVMLNLCDMVEHFQKTPESKLPRQSLPGNPFVVVRDDDEDKVGTLVNAYVTPLEAAEIKRIDKLVPWPYEVEAYRKLAKVLTGETSDAMGHLIWYAAELSKDREPLTNDKLEEV